MENSKKKLPIFSLSDNSLPDLGDGSVLLMVGSFNPPHNGHVEAMSAACKELGARGKNIAGIVYVPNSDSYVSTKARDDLGLGSFDNRVRLFIELLPESCTPTFVDDLSGSRPPVDTITNVAIDNISGRLNVSKDRIIVVVGSDQAYSLEPVLLKNKTICVIRPGSTVPMVSLFRQEWFHRAVDEDRCIITDRDNPYEDINSTQIRNSYVVCQVCQKRVIG